MDVTDTYFTLSRYLGSGLFDRIKTILLEHKAQDGKINLTKAGLLKQLKKVSDDLLPEIDEALKVYQDELENTTSRSRVVYKEYYEGYYEKCKKFHEDLERNGRSLYERWEKSNFDINVRGSDGDTLLHSACEIPYGCYSPDGPDSVDNYIVAEWLIKNGAFVNAVGHENFRPLHIAVRYIDSKMVKLLVENGVDPNALCKFEYNNKTYRETALSFAKHSRNFIRNDYPDINDKNEQIISILSPITKVKDYSSFIPFYTYQLSLAFFCTAVASVCSALLGAQKIACGFAIVSGICLILAVTKYCLVKSIDNTYMRQVLDANEQEKNLLNEKPEVQMLVDNVLPIAPEVLHQHQ